MDKQQTELELQTALQTQSLEQLNHLARQAVEHFPDESFGYAYLAEAFLLETPPNYPKAELCLAKAIEQSETEAVYYERFIQLKEAQGQWEDAYTACLQLLNRVPDSAFGQRFMGVYKLRFEQLPDLALPYIEQALSRTPDDAALHLYKAEALLQTGRADQALAEWQAALPSGAAPSEDMLLFKIQILQEQGNVQAANAVYAELVERQPQRYEYLLEWGYSLFHAGERAAAEQALERAWAARPEGDFDPALAMRLGELLLENQKPEQALPILEMLVAAQPQQADPLLLLAEALNGSGQYDRALQALQQAEKQTDDDLLLGFIRLQKALALAGSGKGGQALELVQPLAEQAVFQTEAEYVLGLILHQTQGPQAAYPHLKNARRLGFAKALPYLQTRLSDYLEQTRKAVFEALEPQSASIARSPLIQKISEKIWLFDSMKSKKLENYPEDFRKKMEDMLRLYAVIFTEKGFLMVQTGSHEAAAYSIEKAGGDALLLNMHPVDGLPAFPLRVRVEPDGLLCSKEDGEYLRFKAASGKLPEAFLDNFRRSVSPAELDFLGDKAASIRQIVFSNLD